MIIADPVYCREFFQTLKKHSLVVAVSGYFDPPTPGHLLYLNAAKKLGDVLVAIVNNDSQLLQKRQGTKLENKIRYPWLHRALLIDNLKAVDVVVGSIDGDETVARTLDVIKPHIFAKGGDRNLKNLPEQEIWVCTNSECEMVFGVGGDFKAGASSSYDWE